MSVTDAVPAGTRAAPDPGRWWTLGIVTLATSMLMLDLTVVNVALPTIRTDLEVDTLADLQWVLDAYALTLGVFLLTGGSLADRYGRKWIFLAGFAVFSVASLACGLAWDVLSLDVARGIQGFGAAVLFAVGPTLIAENFHGKERAQALGIFAAGFGVAIAAGPLVGGALTDGPGWRWIFLVNVPLGVLAVVVGAAKIRAGGERTEHPTDWLGLVLFTASMTALVVALLRGNAEGWRSGPILGLLAAAAVLMAAFLVLERRLGPRAMLDLSLFRIVSFDSLAAVTALVMGTGMAAIFLIVAFLQNDLGLSPWSTGLRVLPLSAVLMVVGGVAGALTLTVPFRVLLGVAATAAAAALLAVPVLVGDDSGWTALLVTMVLLGIGLGVFNPTRAAMAIAVVEPRRTGMSNGVSETFQQVGVAVGIAGFGALFQARIGAHLAGTGLPGRSGLSGDELGEAVSAGGSRAVAAVPGLGPDAVAPAHHVVVTSLGEVMTVGGVALVLAAVVGFAVTRSRDLAHTTADEPAAPVAARATPVR